MYEQKCWKKTHFISVPETNESDYCSMDHWAIDCHNGDGIDYIENSCSSPNDWVMRKLSFASQPFWNHPWQEILTGCLHAIKIMRNNC